MNSSTKDHIKGGLRELEGKAKEKVGQITNNPTLAAEGRDEELAGKIQKRSARSKEYLRIRVYSRLRRRLL